MTRTPTPRTRPQRKARAARRAAALVASLAVALLPDLAHAQQAALQVQLRDATTGEPVAGVTVTLSNAAIGFRRAVVTDANGQAILNGLSTSGAYRASIAPDAERAGLDSAPLTLRSDYTHTLTLSLPAASLETVTIRARPEVSGLNTVDAQVAATLGATELAALPIEGRDVLQALVRLPNVVPSTGFFPEAPAISINGANGLYVNYLIDGLDNNENFLGGPKFPVSLGMAREITVLANSFSVEFGRSAYGVVNVTSRSASNEFEAEAYALFRPGRPPDSGSPYPRRDLSGNPVGDSFSRAQYGGSLGLPLVEDRTFLHVNAEFTRDTQDNVLDAPALGVVGNVTGHNRFALASARLDHRINDEWLGTLRLNHGRVSIERPGGSLGGGNVSFPSAGSDQERISTLIAASASYSGARFDYEGSLLLSAFDWDYAHPRAAGPQVAIRDPSGLTVGIVGHPGYAFDERERTVQLQQKLRFERGAHHWLLGGDVMVADFALRGGSNPDGNYTVDLSPAQLAALRTIGPALSARDVLALNPAVASYGVELRPASFGRSQTLAALYLEDRWTLRPGLTAKLGLRWDYDSLTGEGGGGADLDNLSPRLSLNYQPNERTVLRAGAGLFVDKINYTVISDALQRNTTGAALRGQLQQLIARGLLPADTRLDRVTFDGNLTVSPPCATVAQCPSPAAVQALRESAPINEVRILNPAGYDSPTSTQLSLGVQHELQPGWVASADLLYNRTRHLVRLRDLNAPAPFVPNAAALTPANIALLRAQPDNSARLALARSLGLVRTVAEADATRPVAQVPGGARQITVSDTGGNARYEALNLQLVKARQDDRHAFRLSYTLSRLVNDTDDLNFRASDANNFSRDEGPSANDRRHVVSAVAYLYPLPGLTLSVAGLFQSGQPVNFVPDAQLFGTQDLNGDGASFGENFVGNSDRYPGVSRNAGRLPWSTTIDLGARYAFGLGAQQLEASIDVFNLLDANNESGFANAATTSNQVQFGGGAPFVQRNAAAPRQFQFGIAWKR